MRPDRHAFVLLAEPPDPHVYGGDLAEVEAWRLGGLPFVVASARGDDPPDTVRLGLATPDKRRIGFRANLRAVGAVLPPPDLAGAALHAPIGWSMTIGRVAGTCAAAGLEASVFGSLAWTCRTGHRFLREGSDLDLLLTLRPEADLPGVQSAVAELMKPTEESPRIDGELLLADGSAVNLRELAAGSPEVLVKAHGGAKLARFEDVAVQVRWVQR